MSTKKRVILFLIIFVSIAMITNVAIISYNGGFNVPGQKDLWIAGKNIKTGDKFVYELTTSTNDYNDGENNNYIVQLTFRDLANYWNTQFVISNISQSLKFVGNLSKSNLIQTETQQEYKKYMDIIDSSILSIRDITREPKYLVVGAQWDSISTGVTDVPIKVISRETINIPIGEINTFVLNFNINQKNSNIWINDNISLPVKAEVYNEDGTLKYKFILKDIDTNSFKIPL